MTTYRNIHTKEIMELDHVETVKNYPDPIIVYVFKDGDRWEMAQVIQHLELVESVGEAEER